MYKMSTIDLLVVIALLLSTVGYYVYITREKSKQKSLLVQSAKRVIEEEQFFHKQVEHNLSMLAAQRKQQELDAAFLVTFKVSEKDIPPRQTIEKKASLSTCSKRIITVTWKQWLTNIQEVDMVRTKIMTSR